MQQFYDNAAKAGFTVRVKLVKESRAIKWVKFEIIKTTERLALDAKLQDREKQLNLFDVHLKTTTYEQAKTMAPGWDIYTLAAEWKAWASQQKDWPPKNTDAAFWGFCKKRGPVARMR